MAHAQETARKSQFFAQDTTSAPAPRGWRNRSQSLEWGQAGGTWEGRSATQAPPSMLDDDALRYIRRRRRVEIENDGVIEEVLLDDESAHIERSGKIFAGGY